MRHNINAWLLLCWEPRCWQQDPLKSSRLKMEPPREHNLFSYCSLFRCTWHLVVDGVQPDVLTPSPLAFWATAARLLARTTRADLRSTRASAHHSSLLFPLFQYQCYSLHQSVVIMLLLIYSIYMVNNKRNSLEFWLVHQCRQVKSLLMIFNNQLQSTSVFLLIVFII